MGKFLNNSQIKYIVALYNIKFHIDTSPGLRLLTNIRILVFYYSDIFLADKC